MILMSIKNYAKISIKRLDLLIKILKIMNEIHLHTDDIED